MMRKFLLCCTALALSACAGPQKRVADFKCGEKIIRFQIDTANGSLYDDFIAKVNKSCQRLSRIRSARMVTGSIPHKEYYLASNPDEIYQVKIEANTSFDPAPPPFLRK